MMLVHCYSVLVLLTAAQFLPSNGFEKIYTEQDAATLRPSRLFVQVLTEPESLIRLFEGLDLAFQMFRHWGRTGSALVRLPFNQQFLNRDYYDYAGLDPWKRPYYSRVPTMNPAEAPRFVKMSRSDDEPYTIIDKMDAPYQLLL